MSDPDWERLDPRTVLVAPVRVLGQATFALAAAVIGLSQQSMTAALYGAPAIALLVLLVGTLPYFVTRFRVNDNELLVRTGLISRKTLTAPLSRIRSVDLEASLLHRILNVVTVKIGTGVDEDRIDLDALSQNRAEVLRRTLHTRQAPEAESAGLAEQSEPDAHAEDQATLIAQLRPSWARFAPFNFTQLVIVGGLIGTVSQFGFQEQVAELWAQRDYLDRFAASALTGIALATLMCAAVVWALVAMVGYLVHWWDLRLSQTDSTLNCTYGLFTRRSITIDQPRIRGVRLKQPPAIRLLGGAEVSTLATGVGSEGTATVLPWSTRAYATGVAETLISDPHSMRLPLQEHGKYARRRIHLGHLVGQIVPVAGICLVVAWFDWSWWLAVAASAFLVSVSAVAAEMTYRNLGHALTDRHLIAGHRSASRVRTALERDGVIGWVVRSSWLQRRRNLVTLIATTAAGDERVTIADVPAEMALAVSRDTSPDLMDEFLERT